MTEMNLRHYAYLGDAVWELFIREHTIYQTPKAEILHKLTTAKVKASYQAELLNTIENELTKEESDITRRARNLPVPAARRSNQSEYRQATAFEALIGWWYLNNKPKLENFLKKFEENL